MSRKRRINKINSGRGALWLIAAMLLGSGAIRLATGTGNALVREVEEITNHASASVQVENCEKPERIEMVLKALAERQSRLEEREAMLADRQAALDLAKQEIDKNLIALVAAERDLSQTIALAETAAEGDLARLTSVYENMKPKEAAQLFEEMAPDFAAGFLGRMRPDAAAAIMAGLSATTAYTISVVLAGRNANAPTE